MIITLFLMGKFPFFQENRMLFLFCQRVQFETEQYGQYCTFLDQSDYRYHLC